MGKKDIGFTIGLSVITLFLCGSIYIVLDRNLNRMKTSYSSSNVVHQQSITDSKKKNVDVKKPTDKESSDSSSKDDTKNDNQKELYLKKALEAAGLSYNNVHVDINGDFIYIIQKNDTLSKISAGFGYSVDELATYNKIKNVNLIYTGSSIRIPHK